MHREKISDQVSSKNNRRNLLVFLFLSFTIACQSSKNFHFFSQLGKNFIVALLNRGTIEFLPSWLKSGIFLVFYQKTSDKMKRILFTSILSRLNLIHVSFRPAKMNLFSPSGQKYHFCPPQADLNLVVPRKNRRKRSIFKKMK